MADYAEEELEQPKSLLDVLCSLLLRNKPLLSRIFVGGRRLQPDTVKAVFEDLTNTQKHKYEGTAAVVFTGLLVESSSTFCAMLEAEPKNVLAILANLQSSPAMAQKVDDVQIFGYSDDIVDRSWPKWAAVEINTPGRTTVHTEDTAAREICDMQQRLIDLGGQVYSKEKYQIDNYLNGVRINHPETLPTVGQVDSILNAGFCLTLEEFLQLYHTPIDIKLQSELVWPIPPPMKY
eukprot:EG_transcript_26293